MNIVVIEDEPVVADDLRRNITQILGESVEVILLHSVKEATSYFADSIQPDMIFSDIQLGDGLSFEIFQNVEISAPIIFCTAYNEYALDAFAANGIDYILKPFTSETLERSIEKYKKLKDVFLPKSSRGYDELIKLLSTKDKRNATSILVYVQDRIVPIKISDIAAFHLENEVAQLLTFSGKVYYPHKTLDELERLTEGSFFRANRQFLVCRKAIVDVSSFFSRKLSLNLTIPVSEKVIVSKGKASHFLEWLSRAE